MCRQLFINTCTYLMIVAVVLEVSAPYFRNVLTFVLKFLTLILVDSCFEFHMFFNCRNAALACFTKPCLFICIGSSLYIDDGTRIRETFHPFQSFSITCDWVDVLLVVRCLQSKKIIMCMQQHTKMNYIHLDS
ncbi:unnamed protein product [Schistosoma margrebowiei]|uniref:Uncharacterized protein n=1 Tax=Schistosoma margrebowiei TaxID=48269 RepID=A0A3P8BE76_9TREM|nr:unnamed protein product [Schistosoma margrebowiei]